MSNVEQDVQAAAIRALEAKVSDLHLRVVDLEAAAIPRAPFVRRAPVSVPTSPALVQPRPAPPPALQRQAAVTPVPVASPAPAPRSLEERIGKRWITWLGAISVFVAAVLFVKLAVDAGWLGPAARITLAGAFGLGLIAAGARTAARSLHSLSHGLIGSGIAILYVVVFAGFAYYDLYSREVGFGLLSLVTLGGAALATRYNAHAIAILATVGGFATPLMVASGADARDALFGYLAILDLGVLVLALARRWPHLKAIAFIATWGYVAGWFARSFDSVNAAPAPILAWVLALYSIFLVLPFAYHLRRRVPLDPGRFALALANAGVTFGFAAWALGDDYRSLGGVSIAMGSAYLVLGRVTRARIPSDGRALFGFLTLAVAFITLAVPLELHRHGITLAWAFEAPVLVCLGYRYRYFPTRATGAIVLGLAAVSLFNRTPHALPFWNLDLASGLLVPAACTAYALLHRRLRASDSERDRVLMIASALAAGLLTLLVCQAEIYQRGEQPLSSISNGVVVTSIALWAIGAVSFMLAGARIPNVAARMTASACAVVSVKLALSAYAEAATSTLFANARYAAALSVVGALYVMWRAVRSMNERRYFDQAVLAVGDLAPGVFVLIVTQLEIARAIGGPLFGIVDGVGVASVALWGVGALGFLAIGVRRPSVPARVAAPLAALAATFILVAMYGDDESTVLFVNARFAIGLGVAAVVFVIWRALRARVPSAIDTLCAKATGAGLVGGLWALLTAEIAVNLIVRADGASLQWRGEMLLTVVWGVYAIAVLALGFVRRYQPLRITGLALFGLTAAKLLLVDLAGVQQIYRVLSFLAIGLLMLGSSYLYHRLRLVASAPALADHTNDT